LALGPQVLGKALGGQADDAIGSGENGLGGAVVAVERDDAAGGLNWFGKSRMLRTVAARNA
jgi:hypothetical protein